MSNNDDARTQCDELDVEPVLRLIYGGRWAAYGLGWAVHADTREDAVRAYWERVALYREVDARGKQPPAAREGR